MTPLPEEQLALPMTLECGLTIYEWRGGIVDHQRAHWLCELATNHFVPYLERHGLTRDHQEPFRWSGALVPDGSCYRCMNDTRFRFARRPVKGWVTGYTSYPQQYTFLVGDIRRADFNVTFVHELFHAMSIYYGVWDSHGETREEQVREDEKLARGFTRWLGLGE